MIGSTDMILFFNKSSVDAFPVEKATDEATGDGIYTCEHYAKEIAAVFESGIKIKTSSDSIGFFLADAKKQADGFDFKEEYVMHIGKNGTKEVTFVCDKDDNKPVYEVIFEFENEDSTRRLAEMMFGAPNHPTLDNHWVLGVGDNNAVSLAWTFNNKMVIASNLPNTELEDAEEFKLPEEFIKKFNGTDNTPADEAADNEATSLSINKLIAEATNDFEDFKTELMPNKKEEYNAAAYVTLGQDQAIVRKNAAGNWRLEVRFTPYATSEEVKEVFEKTLTFYQTLEGLEYRLVKKSDLSTANGRTYIWDIQTLDDQSTCIILKWQSYPTSNRQFGIKMELGK